MDELDDLAARWAEARALVPADQVGDYDPAIRRHLTREDPLAFALVYLRRHLKDKAGTLSLSDVHRAWVEEAKGWMIPPTEPASTRTAQIGPRDVGKSTWWFLILPMWAAAHGWVSFAAAFANTPTQAQNHLQTFKDELERNDLIRTDYPDLVAPRMRARGTIEADRQALYYSRSGFVFGASGIDSSNLGLKVGELRPDLLILDDIEPHEANYSSDAATKRLGTLRDAIFPLNIYARVVIVGTVTMAGSIIHQLVASAKGQKAEPWIAEDGIVAHHYPAIVVAEDGSRRSVWPEKWPLEFLESIEHTRNYAKNYANDPIGADGDYWRMEDIGHGELLGVTRRVLSLDPNVTQKVSSDFSGIAIVSWSPSANACQVEHAEQVKMDPATLRLHIIDLIERFNVGLVLVETNQGGDLWRTILWGLPVKVRSIHQSVKKEVRAAAVLDRYQRGKVIHRVVLRDAEAQLVGFPKAPHDDMVDAIGTGVAYFLLRPAKIKAGATTAVYA